MKRINTLIIAMMAFLVTACDKNDDNDKTVLPQYVDLGLSVKWATFNVGASNPQEYGDYFSWGETETKLHYYWSSYKYAHVNNKGADEEPFVTKYCTDSLYGYNSLLDSICYLDPDDDVAHIQWGGSWRMPTSDEFEELFDTVQFTKIRKDTVNNVIGIRITSKVDGYTDNSIFLPFAGYKGASSPFNTDKNGNYWTSSLNTDEPTYAVDAIINAEGDYELSESAPRYLGYSVRPVCP